MEYVKSTLLESAIMPNMDLLSLFFFCILQSCSLTAIPDNMINHETIQYF